MTRTSFVLRAGLAALMFGTYGCSLLAVAITGQGFGGAPAADPAEEKRTAEEREAAKKKRAEEEAAQEKVIFADIEAMRKEIAASKDPGPNAVAFAKRTKEAADTPSVRSGEVKMPELYAEAAGYLDTSIKKKPTLEAFDALTSLPRSAEIDTKVVDGCARVRALVAPEAVTGFVEECLERAGGDAKKMKWPNASRDVAAYEKAEKARKAAEAEAEAKAKKEQSKVARYVAASVFASGRCKFSNCMKDGWTYSTPEGDIDVSCSFQNCFKDGWTARFPDGTQATTRCSFQDCMKDGWETSFSDGTSARTSCSFQNCLKDGWSTNLPGGGTATTRCSFQDCTKDGWTTDWPGGGSVQCRCNFDKCFENGASCN